MNRLTIVIPTLNRPEFLYRVLKFYKDCLYYRADILVGDGGTAIGETLENELLCKKFKVRYFNYPKIGIGATVKALCKEIKTDYAVILPDDDILIPDGIDRCIEFLDRNRDYTGCTGKAGMFSMYGDKTFGKIWDLGEYKQKGIYKEDSPGRVEELLTDNFVCLFGIFRTEVFKKMWAHCDGTGDVGIDDEVIPCCVAVAEGKIGFIDDIYLLRGLHNNRYLGITGDELKASLKFKISEERFISVLTPIIGKTASVDLFNIYKRRIVNKAQKKPLINIKLLKRIKIWFLNRKRKLTIESLRQSSADFVTFERVLKEGYDSSEVINYGDKQAFCK